ncbi:MAG: polynucleotide adenylyltransferase PcnB [Pseudomonadales bacterium]|nr:MAG: polynucleotide adenylyltransferase PcnB [Pseudomonadales bacterium]
MLKKIQRAVRAMLPASGEEALPEPLILSRDEHSISRRQISKHALTILYDLNKAGHEAYLVGGCIRDLLLGGHPKDFDVATDATPEQVLALFRRARIVGRRFRIVHVRFGREIIEVTTFRASHDDAGSDGRQTDEGMLLRDNVFGSLREDALRRDFTVNALYYTVDEFRVLDYTGGLQDLQARTLRIIGDPEQRYREDPVRMLRAIRFAAKLNFSIEAKTAAPMQALSEQLGQVAPARLFDEVLKLFLGGHGARVFELLQQYQLFAPLFPATAGALAAGDERGQRLIECALANTDQRIANDKPVTPAFLYASLIWPAYTAAQAIAERDGLPAWQARQRAGQIAIEQQQQSVSIPKRFSIPAREIWNLQHNLQVAKGKRAESLLGHPRFRAAYDFMLMREQAGETIERGSDFWTELQKHHPVPEYRDTKDAPRPRRRRRGGARRKPEAQ